MPDLAGIRRAHRRGSLDRVVRVDGRELWAKREEYESEQQDIFLGDSAVSYEQDTRTYVYTVHFDPAILPGQEITDGDLTVTILSVETIGRRAYMRLNCSRETPGETGILT